LPRLEQFFSRVRLPVLPLVESYAYGCRARNGRVLFRIETARPAGDQDRAAGDERLYALTTEGLLFTADSGRTWAEIPLPAITSRVTALLVPADDTILVGAEDGVYYSQDGAKPGCRPPARRTAPDPIPRPSRSTVGRGDHTLHCAGVRDGIDYAAVTSLGTGAELYGLVAIDRALLAATSLGLLRSDISAQAGLRRPTLAGKPLQKRKQRRYAHVAIGRTVRHLLPTRRRNPACAEIV